MLVLFWACGVSGQVDPEPPELPAPDCTTGTIEVGGGEVEHRDVTLLFPGGALSAPTDVTLCTEIAAPGVAPTSTVVKVRPANLVLAAPAVATVRHRGLDDDTAALFAPDADGETVRVVTATTAPGQVEGPLFYAGGLLYVADDARVLEDHDGPLTAVDVLVVVDNSPGMSVKQETLADELETEVVAAVADDVDFHIGFVTADLDSSLEPPGTHGRMLRFGSVPYLDEDAPGLGAMVHDSVLLGEGGSALEKGIGAAFLALDDAEGDNVGFRRDEAALRVVVLSDEADGTSKKVATAESLASLILGAAPRAADGTFYAIVDRPAATAYRDVVMYTGGIDISIWDYDYARVVSELFTLPPNQLLLSDMPDASTIEVWRVPGGVGAQARVPADLVTYDASSNGLTVDPSGFESSDVLWVVYSEG